MTPLIFALLLLENFTIKELVNTIDFYKDHVVSTPKAIVRFDEHLVVADQSAGFWVFDLSGKLERRFGSPGPGPDEFKVPIFSAYREDHLLVVIDDFGSRLRHFDLYGNVVKKTDLSGTGTIFKSEHSQLIIEPDFSKFESEGSFQTYFNHFFWVNKGTKVPFDPGFDPKVERVSGFEVSTHKEWVLLYAKHGLTKKIYYGLFKNSSDQFILDAINQRDPRGQEWFHQLQQETQKAATSPVISGLTSCPDHGFIFTEHTYIKDFRIVTFFDPETQDTQSFRIYLDEAGAFEELHHLAHLKENLWLGFNGESILIFKLEKE